MNLIHDIVSGSHALDSLNYLLGMQKEVRCFILADTGSREHCLEFFLSKASEAERAVLIEIPQGDENKNADILNFIWSRLLEHHCGSDGILINLGGGMVSDIGGFAAGTFNRGISYYNVPTTLLAMVDASIGGKTSINLGHIKNKAGLFVMPSAVFIDAEFLKTLPERHINSGLAEAFKTLIVGDVEHWLWMEKNLQNDNIDFENLIKWSSQTKSRIVSEDFFDTGVRRSLNFGHTLGHAIETLFIRKELSITHGEAVAAGMIMELFLSKQVSGLELDVFVRICTFLNKFFKPLPICSDDIEEIILLCRSDKKIAAGSFFLSLISAPASPDIDRQCDEYLLGEAIRFYIDLYA